MQNPNPLSPIIPMLIVAIPVIILNYKIAIRKGKSQGLYAILGIIPVVNFFCFLYLISLTDKELIDKLNVIYDKLNK